MGGDTLRCFEDESSLDNECPEFPYHFPMLYRDDDESASGSNGFVYKGFDEMGHRMTSNPVEFDGSLRRRKSAYREIMKNYDELWVRRESLYQAKRQILSYTPGSWVSNAGGKKRSNYAIPKTTTLLLIGPKGSGKSSLVNRISRVFEDDKFASERAQVTYNPSSGEGTYFLQEYMIPRSCTSFCLFDTRSLSENFSDNDEMLEHWMTKGVRHGDLVVRDSDSSILKMALKWKAQQSGSSSSEIRKVNFVIFVVNGFSVLRAMNSDNVEAKRYIETVTMTYSCPYLSFKDDKPVIVVTHGDLLSLGDRARVRVYLGEKLGVPPAKQIFDIPENSDPSTELTIVDMIRYSLEYADKNLPCKESREWVPKTTFSEDGLCYKVFRTSILTSMFLAILLGIVCIAFPMHQSQKHEEPMLSSSINWHSKSQVNHHYNPHEPLKEVQSNPHSDSALNHSHENQGSKPPEPQATSPPTKSATATSVPTFPPKSVVVTASAPTPLVKSQSPSAVHSPCKQPKPRSPSPDNRHPKSAVKWHKIRHLYLDSD